MTSSFKYNVYLDIKDTLSAKKVRKLKEILNTKYEVFRNVQNILSKESLLIQLTDFLMGAAAYENNDLHKENTAKKYLINKIEKKGGINLCSTNYSDKFNMFFINLR